MNVYGLLGEKLSHTYSPKIHKLILEYTKLNGEYKLFPVQKSKIDEIINKVREGHIKGLNVTIPYKMEVMKYIEGVSEEAEYIGAVNTICLKNEKLIGYNTDSFGFKNTLINNGVEVENKNVAVLGSGGAAKAIVYILKSMKSAGVDIFSRSPEGSQKGYDELKYNHNYHIIINTTPAGMYPETENSPINKEQIGCAKAVVDIIYNPIETRLLFYAKELGIKHINGMYMLVSQAVKAQEIFNEIKIDADITQKIYKEMAESL